MIPRKFSLIIVSIFLFSLISISGVMAASAPPGSVNITDPLNITYTTNVSSINWTGTDVNESVWYSIDLGVTNSTPADGSAGTNFTNVLSVQGTNIWFIYVNNTGNFVNSTNVTFFLDSIIPSPITIFYPVTNTNYSTNVSNLNYSANDTNLGFCWYSDDYGITNSSPQTCGTNWTVMNSTEGWNNWTVYANDTLNNLNSALTTFWKDTINPTITIETLVNGTTYTSLITTINYTYSDTNVDSCWWTSNSGTANTSITCGTNLTITTEDRTWYTYTFYIEDTSGNQGSSTVTFAIDLVRLTGWTYSVMVLVVGFCALIVLGASLAGVGYVLKNNMESLSMEQLVGYFIGVLIAVMLYSALISYIITDVL